MKTVSRPAPVGGWNARDSLDQMRPEDASVLRNWYPDADGISLRPGSTEHATAAGTVETLAVWEGATGSKLLAAGNGNVYDVTSSGSGSSLTSGHTSNRWQTCNFNQYVFFFNGTDAPQKYDGSTWAAAGFSGTSLTATDLIGGTGFKGRIYLVEKDSAKFWYGGVGAVTGTVTAFDTQQIVERGGYLMAIGTWSRDGGDGLDDLLVLVFSTGEILVYSGTDPTSDFSKQGSYFAAPPIGRRCLVNLGGDLIILTRAGYVPLSLVIQGITADQLEKTPVWGKIKPAAESAASMFSGNWGWQAFQTGSDLMFNIPVSSSIYEQHVLNTTTGAWALYSGINATCWMEYSGDVYFASGAKVYKHTGTSDDGSDIVGFAKQAFDYLGDRGHRKQVTMTRPLLSVQGAIAASMGVDVDFSDRAIPSVTNSFVSENVGSAWDEDDWDEGTWGGAGRPTIKWVSAGGIGRNFAIRLEVRTSTTAVKWYATDYLVRQGGIR